METKPTSLGALLAQQAKAVPTQQTSSSPAVMDPKAKEEKEAALKAASAGTETQMDLTSADGAAPKERDFIVDADQLGPESNITFAGEEPIEDTGDEVIAIYRHKTTPRFRVGQFQFRNHLLHIRRRDLNGLNLSTNEREDLQQLFLSLWDRLHPSDKIQIVKMRVVENETDPSAELQKRAKSVSRTVRGAMSTREIKAPAIPQAASTTKL